MLNSSQKRTKQNTSKQLLSKGKKSKKNSKGQISKKNSKGKKQTKKSLKGGGPELPSMTPEDMVSIIADIIYAKNTDGTLKLKTNEDGETIPELKKLDDLFDAILGTNGNDSFEKRLSLYKDDDYKKEVIRNFCMEFIEKIDKDLSKNESLDQKKIEDLKVVFENLLKSTSV